MRSLLCRNGDQIERVYPAIGGDLYAQLSLPTAGSPERAAAAWILRLSEREFSRLQRLRGRGLDANGQIGRLLLFHRSAFQAELQGQWRRADFFWTECHAALKRLRDQDWRPVHDVCVAAATAVAAEGASTAAAEVLQARFLDEIFVDTHFAVFNGHVRDAEELRPDNRAFSHLDYAEVTLEIVGYDKEARGALLRRGFQDRIAAFRKSREWNLAVQLCERIKSCGYGWDGLQTDLAQLHFDRAIDGLAAQDTGAALVSPLESIDRLRREFPYDLYLYRLLGELHHVRAVKLGNGLKTADALYEVQRAVTYWPSLDGAWKTREQLIEAMKSLQEQAARIDDELKRRPGVQLTAQGTQLRIEARKGFEPMQTFAQSDGAKEIADAYRVAQARSVWRSVGLAEPEQGWDDRALHLVAGLTEVLEAQPADIAAAGSKWEEVARRDDRLGDLDAAAVRRFLQKRLFESDKADAGSEQPENEREGKQPGQSDVAGSVYRPEPIVPTVQRAARQRYEPVSYWFFARRAMATKIRFAAAALFALVVATLGGHELWNRSVRTCAYHDLLAAAASHAHLQAVEAGERFLAAPLLASHDAREENVQELYSHALVSWMVESEQDIDDHVQRHLDRYLDLMPADSSKGGGR